MNRLGTKESPIGSNSDKGGLIDSMSNLFGLQKVPWCAIGGSYFMRLGEVIYPKIWSAMALSFKKAKVKYTMKQISYEEYIPKPGDAVIYNYGGGKGHIDFVVTYSNNSWLLVGANRSDRIAYVQTTTNKLILSKAVYVVSVTGNYDYEIPLDPPLEKGAGGIEANKGLKPFASYDTSKATVYASKFHGREMKNGKLYDSTKISAASNVYKIGSVVTVTNTLNGRSLDIEITDRMSKEYTNDRIDLSKKAYVILGINKKKVIVKYKNPTPALP